MYDEIVPGVFDITCRTLDTGARFRVFLFDGDPPTLVDTGFPDTADAVIQAIDDIGIAPERLVITHADGDHIGAFDALVDRYGLETWVPEQSEVDTTHEPDHRYGDGDRIGPFEAVHVPGHEPDNHVLVDEAAGIAVMGDALFGSDHRGLPPGYFHLPAKFHSSDLDLAEESLDRLLPYAFDVGLVFHGTSVLEDADEKLDRYVNFPTRS